MMRTLSRVGQVIALGLLAGCGGPATDGGATKSTGEAPAPAASTPATIGFRGDGSGRYSKATPPVEWSSDPKKNIVWSVKIGPNKFSSAMLCGNKLFLVAEPADLVCVDATDGKILWRKSNGFDQLPTKTEEKPAPGDPGNTTPTPVTDGKFVYAVFGCGIVACYDLEGSCQWIQYFDRPPATQYGRSASPALIGDRLVVSLSFLSALDTKTGKEVWKNEEIVEVYGTPLPTKIGDVDVVITPTGQIVRVKDGVILANTQDLKYASPIIQGSVLYMMDVGCSAYELPAQAGDKIEPKKLWESDLEGTFYSSAVYDNGLLYAVSNEGKLFVVDAKDGKTVLSQDLEIPSGSGRPEFPAANIYPSLAIAGQYLFISNDAGDTLVLTPGKTYKEVKKNKLDEGSGGTPVFGGQRIYVRGGENLYCIGEK